MNKLDLDDAQRLAACTKSTAVVTAGAGAGKTRALVGRFLYLVLDEHVEPESILALTFTRKAAAEMFQRVYEALSRPGNARPDIASRLSNAHIQTLDSFCREIVAGCATLYGYTPDFVIDETACAEVAHKTAYRYVLDHMQSDGLRELLDAFGFDAVVSDLFASFGSANVEPHWIGKRVCHRSFEIGMREFEQAGTSVVQQLRTIAARILDEASKGAISNFKEGSAKTVRAAQVLLEALDTDASKNESGLKPGTGSIQQFSRLKAFLDYIDKPEHSVNFQRVGKNDIEIAIKEQGQLLLRDKKLLKKLRQIIDFELFLPQYRAAMERLDEYADALCEEKRRANIMNYKDLGALAVDILSQQKDIREYWASRFRYILIDEFQDNNAIQKRLLLLLSQEPEIEPGLAGHAGSASTTITASPADSARSRRITPSPAHAEGKLFFVGDEKQSIYLFRGADVSVFKALASELAAERFALARNYRSAKALIDFFNDVFAVILQPADPTWPQAFEAIYERMEASPEPEPPGFVSRIEYHLVSDEVPLEGIPLQEEYGLASSAATSMSASARTTKRGSILSARESMAFRMAKWIRNAVESSSPLYIRCKNSLRKAEYSDIAILMRTTSRQYEIEKYLRMLAVPFVTETAASLFAEAPVNDLYFILRLLLDSHDLFATAAVLRSPLCRITNDGYVSILTEKMSLAELRASSSSVALTGLSTEDQAAVQRMISFYDALSRISDHLPLMEIISFVWERAFIGLSILSDPQRHPYLEHWNAIRSIAAETEAQGGHVPEFLRTLRAFMDQKRLFDSSTLQKEEAQGVRLMTIHKSKGLEFPIVLIPWMEAGTNKNGGNDLWGVLDAPPDTNQDRYFTIDIGFHDRADNGSNILQTQARTLRVEKEHAETKRLFYVACTRAIDHLILFGAAPSRSYDTDSFHALLFQSTCALHPSETEFLQADGRQRENRQEEWPAAEHADATKAQYLTKIELCFEPLAFEQEVHSERRVTQKPDRGRIAAMYEQAHMIDLARPVRTLTVSAVTTYAARAEAIVPVFSPRIIQETCFEPASEVLEKKGAAQEAASDPAAFGTLVHELFAHLVLGKSFETFSPSAVYRTATNSLCEDTASSASANRSPTPKEPQKRPSDEIERAYRELVPLLDSTCFKTLLEGNTVSIEYPFLLSVPPWTLEGRIDMLIEQSSEVIILDLKTDARFAPIEYALQLGIYQKAIRELFPDKRVRAGLVYLRFGMFAWIDGELEESVIEHYCETLSTVQE
jgi:ATP-dependent exoDNAse (exonuclease V) beta subunit